MAIVKEKRSIITPGHGAQDPGAISPVCKIIEKDWTYHLAVRAEERMDGYEGKHDIFQLPFVTALEDLQTTVKYAVEQCADLLVDIHVNSVDDPAAEGIETFRAPGTPPEFVAMHETFHRAVGEYAVQWGMIDRGPKVGNYHIPRECLTNGILAIIVEVAFLSNFQDATRLHNVMFLDKMGNAIACGIAAALKLKPLEIVVLRNRLAELENRCRQINRLTADCVAPVLPTNYINEVVGMKNKGKS
jgi:N-acetylmuramoyl-L-alanine amidase